MVYISSSNCDKFNARLDTWPACILQLLKQYELRSATIMQEHTTPVTYREYFVLVAYFGLDRVRLVSVVPDTASQLLSAAVALVIVVLRAIVDLRTDVRVVALQARR